jgi:hypothetical protein
MSGCKQGRGYVAARARRWTLAAALMLAARATLADDCPGTFMDHLVAAARGKEDMERREAALRSLAGVFGTQASEELSGTSDDPAPLAEVREVAANLGRRNVEGSK